VRSGVCLPAVFLLMFGFGVGAASAAPITFQFAGTLSQDPLLDPGDPFSGTITSGVAFTGSYTFESTTADSDASSAVGSYTSTGGTLDVTIGGNLFTASDLLNIGVQNGFVDFYTVFAQNTTANWFDLSLTFGDLDGTALLGTALLTDAPSLAQFEITTLFLSGMILGNQVQIDGTVTSLRCTSGCVPGGETGQLVPVPEPASLTLVGLGAAACVARRKRR
jgi:hypothetical protein